jgi:hypothetical protein
MAMTFDHDVLISYAHIDNLVLGDRQEGWITSLHRALEVRLAQLRGVPPRIWRDPKLQGNDFFADEIIGKLPRVAAIVTVLSPRYVLSDWCRKELSGFCAATAGSGGLRVANKARVFKVVKTPIRADQHPPEIQSLLGYDFFTVDPQSGRPVEFNHLGDAEVERRYWAKLDDLAHDISELLDLLEKPDAIGKESAAAVLGAPPEEPARETIYLATTTRDLEDQRDSIRRDLEGSGYQVLPDRPLPLAVDDLAPAVEEMLGRCRLSVHLVGRSYGVVPEGTAKSIAVLQNELAVARAEAGELTRLVWVERDLEAEEERQRAFLEQLQQEVRGQARADVLESTLEVFKLTIHERLRPTPVDEPAGEPAAGSELRRVYLLCDQQDAASAAALEDRLFADGFEVIHPIFEGDPAEVRLDHQENLRLCDGLIVYYGDVHELWLRAKLRDVLKIGGYGRTEPIKVKAIYVAPPLNPQKERFRTLEAKVIHGENGLERHLLDGFVEDLRG